jgi:hypothetical protein
MKDIFPHEKNLEKGKRKKTLLLKIYKNTHTVAKLNNF